MCKLLCASSRHFHVKYVFVQNNDLVIPYSGRESAPKLNDSNSICSRVSDTGNTDMVKSDGSPCPLAEIHKRGQ